MDIYVPKELVLAQGKPCEETNPYGMLTSPEFIESQQKQREILSTPTGFNWDLIDLSGITKGLGLITNPHPASYHRRPLVYGHTNR